MKRFTKIVVLLVLAAILCSVLAGCSSGKNQPTIVYDKKYVYGTTSETYHRYLVFHADHTGYYETFQIYSDDSVCSGKADFVWRAADDGTIYLFSNVLTLSDEDTRGESKFEYGFSWGMPITFGDGFLIALKLTPHVNLNTAYTSVNTCKFVLEGSDLAKSLERD